MKKLLLFSLLLAACGDQDSVDLSPDAHVGPTRGGAANQIAAYFCIAQQRCGFISDTAKCFRHNVHHMCELDATCDEPFDSPNLGACLDRLSEIQHNADPACFVVKYGSLPKACDEFVDDWNAE